MMSNGCGKKTQNKLVDPNTVQLYHLYTSTGRVAP